MPVSRIERIIRGTSIGAVERSTNGFYVCLSEGSNMETQEFLTLDEVADFLRNNPRAGVRMNPEWSKIVKNIFIDGLPR